MNVKTSSPSQVRQYLQEIESVARRGSYFLNPDEEHTADLVESLLVNEDRFGYPACPCRLADGTREEDLDIICPCDYRDSDLAEYGNCFCALYVSEEVAKGIKEARPIPERRPSPEQRRKKRSGETRNLSSGTGVKEDLGYPVWRCQVCGYLCARDEPPGKCPICGADRDRFERFL